MQRMIDRYRDSRFPQKYCTLLEWIFDVSGDLMLESSTFDLCINIVQSALLWDQRTVPMKQWQLVGAASLWIACKFDSTTQIESETLIEYGSGSFSVDELVCMERVLLRDVMQYRLFRPTIVSAVAKLCNDMNVSNLTARVAMALVEFAIVKAASFNEDVDPFAKSIVSMAAVCTGDNTVIVDYDRSVPLWNLPFERLNDQTTLIERHGEECIVWMLHGYLTRRKCKAVTKRKCCGPRTPATKK